MRLLETDDVYFMLVSYFANDAWLLTDLRHSAAERAAPDRQLESRGPVRKCLLSHLDRDSGLDFKSGPLVTALVSPFYSLQFVMNLNDD